MRKISLLLALIAAFFLCSCTQTENSDSEIDITSAFVETETAKPSETAEPQITETEVTETKLKAETPETAEPEVFETNAPEAAAAETEKITEAEKNDFPAMYKNISFGMTVEQVKKFENDSELFSESSDMLTFNTEVNSVKGKIIYSFRKENGGLYHIFFMSESPETYNEDYKKLKEYFNDRYNTVVIDGEYMTIYDLKNSDFSLALTKSDDIKFATFNFVYYFK